MDSLIILAAFAFGFASRQIGQPPLVGYLVAGFALGIAGFESSATIESIANTGISLMLFIIGLKLDIRSLLKPEIYRSTFEHTAAFGLVTLGFLSMLAVMGLPLVADISWQQAALVAFALSFSSTVCTVAMLEEHGEFRVRHGQIAVGILIVQDIVAVLFLTVSTGKIPLPWALLLPLLYFARPAFSYVLRSSGHDEVLILAGASGFSYEDVAQMTGVAVGTVKSRVNRARARLCELLDLRPGEDPIPGADANTRALLGTSGIQAA